MNKGELVVLILVNFLIFGFLGVKIVEVQNKRSEQTSSTNPMIAINSPKPNSTISSPLKISGRARGNWFFEASFPIILEDLNGNLISQNHATAKSDWMTADFVPFEAELIFETPISTKSGLLILKKDNPSGLPENDDSIKIPVKFK